MLTIRFPLVPFSSSFHGCLAAEFVFHLNHGHTVSSRCFQKCLTFKQSVCRGLLTESLLLSALNLLCKSGPWGVRGGLGTEVFRAASAQDLCWFSWGWRFLRLSCRHLNILGLSSCFLSQTGWQPERSTDLPLDPSTHFG